MCTSLNTPSELVIHVGLCALKDMGSCVQFLSIHFQCPAVDLLLHYQDAHFYRADL